MAEPNKSDMPDGMGQSGQPIPEPKEPPIDVFAPETKSGEAVAPSEKRDIKQDKAVKDVPVIGQTPEKKGHGDKLPVNKAEKTEKEPKPGKPKNVERTARPPKGPKEAKHAVGVGGGISGQSAGKSEKRPAPTVSDSHQPPEPLKQPGPPRDATRPGETEQIVYITHAELFPFKNHPFQIRDDEAMKSLVASVKERGVDQPALVRPRDGGGYELVAGHRRQKASELAGYTNIPCVVRNMTDDEAVLAMAESNFNQRAEILPSERAKALKMQLEAIKHQGTQKYKDVAANGEVTNGDIGKRSNEVIAERNGMAVKQVQRYIALNNLTPELLKLVDDKKIPFTPAVEMSYIKPKNQQYIAVAIEGQQSAPSLSQTQRMRELDQKGILNGDVIDGIMLEDKKEEIKVVLNSQELSKYFGAEKTPREMKDQIVKLLDEWKGRQPELAKPEKKQVQEK